jgi:hypothetical protein
VVRNHVTFRYPAEFVSAADFDGIMSIDGAGWFVELLRKVPRLAIDPELCQEDWGVVVFGARDGFTFWFGFGCRDDEEWLAHVNHRGLLQRFRGAGKAAYAALISDLHVVLHEDGKVADMKWYDEVEIGSGDALGATSPVDA